MGKINIISNISSKKHAGTPFCLLDNKKKCNIENDKILISTEGEHELQIGYLYAENTEDGRLINYSEKIFPERDEEWYLYRVPFLLNGKGKMKKISKTRFAMEVVIRKFVNSWLFVIAFIALIILSYFL